MTQEPTRRYNMKDVDMLLAAATITDSAIANEDFLTAKRATWAKPFFKNLRVRIDDAITNHLGVDGAKELRKATQSLLALSAPALIDLAEAKVQIEVDFEDDKTRRNEILNTLGFTQYYATAKNRDQEALIDLLYAFKTNLTPELKGELVGNGIAETLLDAIVNYSDALKDSNILQEGKKGTKKEITAAAITEFNAVHKAVAGVARISRNLCRLDKAKADQFSFTKVASNLNLTTAKAKAN